MTDKQGRFHNYLRISVTERCNLRCQYCMPEEGVPLKPSDQLLSTAEITRTAKLFVRAGVDKIRLTGGEPTVRKDIKELVHQLGQLEGLKTLAMTTNGLVLEKKLPDLMKFGLNMLNVSLDTLDPLRFTLITRRLGWENVMASINKAIQLGISPIKVNCVVIRGVNDDELLKFVEWTKTTPIQVRFIEYMPFEGNAWSGRKFLPYTEMIDTIQKGGYVLRRQTCAANETSKNYMVEGHAGSVGFITSMSEHFCSTCNRLRLMADGALKVCLFGQTEVSLRDKIRAGATDEQLYEVIEMAVKKKKPSHDGMHVLDKNKGLNRPMILIGG
uniref:GTP 3',8-cyclase n=1 Tax=Arcella intermedia TaxID=1963864 RepID=A0A6B2L8C0_9EUKA